MFLHYETANAWLIIVNLMAATHELNKYLLNTGSYQLATYVYKILFINAIAISH